MSFYKNLQKDATGWFLATLEDSLSVVDQLSENQFITESAAEIMRREITKAFGESDVVYLEPLGSAIDKELERNGISVKIPGVIDVQPIPNFDDTSGPVTKGIPLLIVGAGIAYAGGYAFGRYIAAQLK